MFHILALKNITIFI